MFWIDISGIAIGRCLSPQIRSKLAFQIQPTFGYKHIRESASH